MSMTALLLWLWREQKRERLLGGGGSTRSLVIQARVRENLEKEAAAARAERRAGARRYRGHVSPRR